MSIKKRKDRSHGEFGYGFETGGINFIRSYYE